MVHTYTNDFFQVHWGNEKMKQRDFFQVHWGPGEHVAICLYPSNMLFNLLVQYIHQVHFQNYTHTYICTYICTYIHTYICRPREAWA